MKYLNDDPMSFSHRYSPDNVKLFNILIDKQTEDWSNLIGSFFRVEVQMELL